MSNAASTGVHVPVDEDEVPAIATALVVSAS